MRPRQLVKIFVAVLVLCVIVLAFGRTSGAALAIGGSAAILSLWICIPEAE